MPSQTSLRAVALVAAGLVLATPGSFEAGHRQAPGQNDCDRTRESDPVLSSRGLNLLNYSLSLTRVSTGRYVLGSFLGMLPGTPLYVYLGSLGPAAAELTKAGAGAGGVRTWFYAGGLIATVAVVVVATRAAKNALKSELAEGR